MGMLDLDWSVVLTQLGHVFMAYILALPLAWDRETKSRGAGLRTFPLVAVASCSFVLIAVKTLPLADSQARILQGIITGIGFIGGGAILKQEGKVSGLATAATIWGTGAIGTACGYGFYEIALVITVVSFITLRVMEPLKDRLNPAAAGSKRGTAPA